MAEPATLYEAMYILDVRTPDEEAQQISDTLKTALTGMGGEFVSDELFARRRLAYAIEGHVEGIFRIMYFRGNGAIANEVKHQFALIEPIVRGMIVVASPKALFSVAPAKPAEAPAEEVEAEAAAEEAAGETAAPAEVAPEESVAEPPTQTEEAAETPAEEQPEA